ncbi:hypothetical protein C9J85_09260 [Haloferax sp. wsp5]|nr:hypothetical protein C9J85_09260 [Haloferax sp. wsp5]
MSTWTAATRRIHEVDDDFDPTVEDGRRSTPAAERQFRTPSTRPSMTEIRTTSRSGSSPPRKPPVGPDPRKRVEGAETPTAVGGSFRTTEQKVA